MCSKVLVWRRRSVTEESRSSGKRYSSPEQVISELCRVTCHVGSHSVICHLTQVNTRPDQPQSAAAAAATTTTIFHLLCALFNSPLLVAVLVSFITIIHVILLNCYCSVLNCGTSLPVMISQRLLCSKKPTVTTSDNY